MREVQRKSPQGCNYHALARRSLNTWLKRAERIRNQHRSVKNKRYTLRVPELESIDKGDARKTYEIGVKSALVIAHQDGMILSAFTCPSERCDCHTLSAMLEHATNLAQDTAVKLRHIVIALGFLGLNTDEKH